MSRTKKAAAKRKRDAQADPSNKKRQTATGAPPTPDSGDGGAAAASPGPASLGAVVSEAEVEIAVDTLRALSGYPAILKSKGCRDLRSAVFDFRQACTTGANTGGSKPLPRPRNPGAPS